MCTNPDWTMTCHRVTYDDGEPVALEIWHPNGRDCPAVIEDAGRTLRRLHSVPGLGDVRVNVACVSGHDVECVDGSIGAEADPDRPLVDQALAVALVCRAVDSGARESAREHLDCHACGGSGGGDGPHRCRVCAGAGAVSPDSRPCVDVRIVGFAR